MDTGKLLTPGIDGPMPTGKGCLTFKASVLDFRSDHPDFQKQNIGQTVKGMVETFLGADGNPVYVPGAGGVVKDAASFTQWWKSVPNVNSPADITLTARETALGVSIAAPAVKVGTDDKYLFYPVDGKGFGNVDIVAPDTYASTKTVEADDKAHNNLFTVKIEAQFYYQGGKKELISILSDDDSWVFLNGKLAPNADLGGLHSTQEPGTVVLDSLAASHGLKPGKIYPITFFYADRFFGEAQYRLEANNILFVCKP
ncbi:MAG: fibro-slime domain-containing protein [Deltaproteobacteria bacterium]|nr:fibro-slime domain-containing protein [Deltaproteobacteria bacterium]